MNTEGMQSVRAPVDAPWNTAGRIPRRYPRASQVARRPPDGKLECRARSRIQWTANDHGLAIVVEREERVALAVSPVWGWNQWVK